MLTAGSRAAEHHEPGQIRKEAALSEVLRVLRECLARVGSRPHRRAPRHDGGVTISPQPEAWRYIYETLGIRCKMRVRTQCSL